MSPCSRMCVCVSISPGRHVECERSITSASAGTVAPTSLIFPSSTTITTFLRRASPRPSKRFPHFKASVFAGDACVCAQQHPAAATTKQIAAILRIMISSNSKDSPLFIYFIFGGVRGFHGSGHHLKRSRALLFEFGMRQRLAGQHLIAHGGVVHEDRLNRCCLRQVGGLQAFVGVHVRMMRARAVVEVVLNKLESRDPDGIERFVVS